MVKVSPSKLRSCILFSAVILTGSIFSSCGRLKRGNDVYPQIQDSSIEKGKSLAMVYCKSCHEFPDPSLLNMGTWEESVLPNMGPRLGIFNFNFKEYPNERRDPFLDSNYYPSKPVITQQEWQNIIDYYLAMSPEQLPAHRKTPIKMGLANFKVIAPTLRYGPPTISYVKIDETVKPHSIFASDAGFRKIFHFDNNLNLLDSVTSNGPIPDMEFQNDSILITNAGKLNPNNGKFGKAEYFERDKNGKFLIDTTFIFDSLSRPVQITSVDLNNDKRTDYLVCEFGYLKGYLSWMENKGGGKFERHVLSSLPGAIKAYVNDYNHDGLPDVWVLFARAPEGIFLFTNKGNGKFDQQQLLQFPPIYGSSYFELDDFNNDGHPDILYTCGDNGDISRVLKPYHGIYIFMNDGSNHFEQKYFFPMNGCYKAMARDFDGDGDLDIAAISFFADYAHEPEEGFVYLENNSDFDFQPYSFEEGKFGRWLTMDVGDLDGDGKPDIVLGNFSKAPSITAGTYTWVDGPPIIVLKNVSTKR
ncbi:MAG: hypothetical protein C5B52_01890 [Bacteroidetes bacterium]|nr:MAG: hypothetical protein C5B52_01890 [Bacteroidota bacterium]